MEIGVPLRQAGENKGLSSETEELGIHHLKYCFFKITNFIERIKIVFAIDHGELENPDFICLVFPPVRD